MKMTATLLAISLVALAQVSMANGNGGQAINNVLTAEQAQEMRLMREEEKMARDVYDRLHQVWGVSVFDHISNSEQRHANRIKALLANYGMNDPVVNDSPGVFQNQVIAGLYQQLLQRGQTSALEALYVGALVEETDIQDLQRAIKAATQSDVKQVYSNLLRASHNHLRAFVQQIKQQNGGRYEAQLLPQQTVDTILAAASTRGGHDGQGHGQGRGHGQGGGQGRGGHGYSH